LVQQILADPDIAAFISREQLSPTEIQRSISKFNQYITERDRFLLEDQNYIAKGYKPILVKNELFKVDLESFNGSILMFDEE